MNGNGEDQSTDTTIIPAEATPTPGPTPEQLADLPSAQLPPPSVRRAQLVKLPPPPAAPGPAPTPEELSDLPQGATPIPTPPPVQRAKLAPGATTQYQGFASTFADQKDVDAYHRAKARGATEQQALQVGDNGIGTPALGSVSTPNSYGIAVPHQYLVRHFGNDPANWRTARGEVTYNGQTVRAPFVDIGPGGKPQKQGVITDLTSPLAQGLGTGGMGRVTLRYIPNAGPDYMKDRDAWYDEQGQIGQQFKPSAQIGAEPAPTPSLPTPSTESWESTPDQGYDQSYQHLGGSGAAINA